MQSNKKAKSSDDSSEPGVSIILEKQVCLTFSLKYLSNFAKSAPLAREVSLHMSNDVPLLVQFDFEQGTLQFFLAPKVSSPARHARLRITRHHNKVKEDIADVLQISDE